MSAQEQMQPFRWRYGNVDDHSFSIHGRDILPLLVAFLFLSLFFIILCLYLRWASNRFGADATPTGIGLSTSTSAAHRLMGLDAVAINGLPVQLYQASQDGEEVQCSICISVLVEGEKVKRLPGCGHCFHPECVDAWLRSRPSCPLCRSSLVVKLEAATQV